MKDRNYYQCPRGCGPKLFESCKRDAWDEETGESIPGLLEVEVECVHCDYMTFRYEAKMKMFIMRGIPGSGKSTKAREIAKDDNAVILSTDDYWLRPDGKYDFNGKFIGDAHKWNRECASAICEAGTQNVVVDNTNTQAWEYEEYVKMAKANGYEVELVAVHGKDLTDEQVNAFAERNTHGVPHLIVRKMYDRFEV